MTASIALVLFDMEGVLSRYDRSVRVDRLSAVSGQPPDVVRHAIWGSGLEARADAGEIGDEQYLDELGAMLKCAITRDDWLAARRASITPDEEAIALASRVSKRRKIAVLTNNSCLVTDHIGYLNPPVARVFGPHVYSTASFGATKPARQAYLRCIAVLGVAAGQTLFVDDSEANVIGAVEAGLQGYRFVGVRELEEEFGKYGVV
jgi:putative hydrolase of the HAD superfamily